MTTFFIPKHLSKENREIVIRLHEQIRELHDNSLFNNIEEEIWNKLKGIGEE